MKNYPVDKSKCNHTPCPEPIKEWLEWAAKMRKTHKAKECPNCGFFKIWEKKK